MFADITDKCVGCTILYEQVGQFFYSTTHADLGTRAKIVEFSAFQHLQIWRLEAQVVRVHQAHESRKMTHIGYKTMSKDG